MPVTSCRAAFTACLALISLAPCLVRTDAPLAASGSYALTQAMVNDDLAVWRLVVGRPLAPADRQAITAVDVSLFHRDPAWLTTNVRQTHKALPRLLRADAVTLAGLRQANLVNTFCKPETQHLTTDEAAQLQAVLRRYIPIVGVDTASGAVITGRDIDAWVAATRFVTTQAHVPAPPAGYRANLVQLAQNPSTLGSMIQSDATDMERNWAALQLVWPHLPAAERTQVLGQYLPKVKQAAASGKNYSTASVVALQASANAAGEYPYALNPRLAAYKRMMDMRMGLFNQHMLEYNMQNMMRSQEDYQRGLRGEGPNPVPIPVPVP